MILVFSLKSEVVGVVEVAVGVAVFSVGEVAVAVATVESVAVGVATSSVGVEVAVASVWLVAVGVGVTELPSIVKLPVEMSKKTLSEHCTLTSARLVPLPLGTVIISVPSLDMLSMSV